MIASYEVREQAEGTTAAEVVALGTGDGGN